MRVFDTLWRQSNHPHPNPPPLAGEGWGGGLDCFASLAMTIVFAGLNHSRSVLPVFFVTSATIFDATASMS